VDKYLVDLKEDLRISFLNILSEDGFVTYEKLSKIVDLYLNLSFIEQKPG